MLTVTDTVTVTIPVKLQAANASATRTVRHFPIDIEWRNFFDRICAIMEISPVHAELAYKFSTELKRDLPHRISNEEEFRLAIARNEELCSSTRRKKVVTMDITNLAPDIPPPPLVSALGRKRKQVPEPSSSQCLSQGSSENAADAVDSNNNGDDYLQKVRMLKICLACQKHHATRHDSAQLLTVRTCTHAGGNIIRQRHYKYSI